MLLSTVWSLGVSFNVYKVGDKIEWTSLLGGGGGVEKRLQSKVEKTESLDCKYYLK